MRTDENEVAEDELEEAPEAVEPEEVEAEIEIPESFPEYTTKADHDALSAKLDQITNLIAAGPQRTSEPVKPEPKPVDTRSPYEVAVEEAERQGIVREDWIQGRAMQIQEDRITGKLIDALGPLLAPVLESHAISQVTGGDAALNAEVQAMIQQGVVNAQALQDSNVKTVVLDAARFRLAQKEDGGGGGTSVKKTLPGAAPTRTVLGANSSGGVRGKLNPAQRADLKAQEERFGVKYDDDDIREAYGA